MRERLKQLKNYKKWQHPGGKLRECGAETLSDIKLLTILISTSIKGKSAEELAKEILKD